ncbi:Myb-like DNA-binding domain protein [Onchocerca flexuosa]|uniref:Myb-like DNA-binding domain protein n=1 Tax=Onchocerca flexuosa TaxID=387005 RepID=A0A238C5K0_9BILA|nr:Myb-like DNA-binding domain protein [Onchocerca flexuosa]
MPSKPKPASPIKAQSDDTSPLSATILISEKTLQETEISERGAVEVQELQFIPTISESISNDLNKAEADILMGKPSFVSDYTSESLMSLKSPEFIPKPQSSSPSKSPRPHSPLKSPVSVASSIASSGIDQSFVQRSRTASSATFSQLSPTKDDYSPKMRKKFTGSEPLDPKTMTMQDLIFWNPKNEKKLHEDSRKKRKDNIIDLETVERDDVESKQKRTQKPAFAAPQVKIAADGSLVIDESSLTIMNENDSSVWETVQEDRSNKKLNSMSFRKRPFCRGNPWSELETDLFYDILSKVATGPDFGLMHEFFPSRTRLELKAKYNREERFNWTRLNQAMAVPTLLSDALYSHANEIIDRIKEKEIKKKDLKLSKKNGTCNDTTSEVAANSELAELITSLTKSIDWNEEEADLEAEAEEAILKLLEDEEQFGGSSEKKARKQKVIVQKKMKDALLDEVAEEAVMVLKGKKSERRKNELKKMCETALSKLDEDFPKFEILIDENADGVTVEANSSSKGLPIVKIPLGTIPKVLPVDEKHPQRVFFDCFAKQNIAARQYVIQHQMGPGEPTTVQFHVIFLLLNN